MSTHFDFAATGGGELAGKIPATLEAALSRHATTYRRYGSCTHKQVSVYGWLEAGLTRFKLGFGFYWGVGGSMVWNCLAKLGPQALGCFKARVARAIAITFATTFASGYKAGISLAELLRPDVIAAYARCATGGKFLRDPGLEAVSP